MSDLKPTADELMGRAITAEDLFETLQGSYVWDCNGCLCRIKKYMRQHYWGERVFEIKEAEQAWRYDRNESELRLLKTSVAQFIINHYSETDRIGLAKSLRERELLLSEAICNAPAEGLLEKPKKIIKAL